MNQRETVQSLRVADATGLWRVRGTSGTAYLIDADRNVAVRLRAEGASSGPYDGCWMALLGVENTKGRGVVEIGYRHRWDFDPNPGEPGFTIWWIQTTAQAIERLEPSDRPEGRSPKQDENETPFTRAQGLGSA